MKLVDCRNRNDADNSYVLADLGDKSPVFNVSQIIRLEREFPDDAIAVVPDFLQYARMLGSGRYFELLRQPQSKMSVLKGVFAIFLLVIRHPLKLVKRDFWLVADALLQYDLAMLPKSFSGKVLLHPYLADLAFAFNKREYINKYFKLAARYKPGVYTYQIKSAKSCMARWNLHPSMVVYSCAVETDQTGDYIAQESVLKYTEFIPDLSYFPPMGQRLRKSGLLTVS